MNYLLMIFLSEENDKFADLKEIADKIIPDDPWAFLIQILATFILVLILAKFLVKPVKKYIQQRTEYVQGNIDEAIEKKANAEKMLNEADVLLKQAKKDSKELVENAKVSALNEKDKVMNETQNEITLMKEKARQDINNERKQMQEQFSNEVIDISLLAASKVVERNMNDEDNQKIVSSFLEDNQ